MVGSVGTVGETCGSAASVLAMAGGSALLRSF